MARKKKEVQMSTNEVAVQETAVAPVDASVENQYQELENVEQSLDMARLELERVRQELAALQDAKKNALKIDDSRREIDADERKIIEKQHNVNNERNTLRNKIEEQKRFDKELVTGKFIHRHKPGGMAKLTYIKYADDLPKWWTFEDNKIYTIPRGFADQINEYYHKPRFIEKPQGSYNLTPATTGDNSSIHSVDREDKMYAFVPVNF